MLRELNQVLVTRLAPLNVPVYQADCVPDGAAFPYITLAAAAPLGETSAGTLTLTIWDDTAQANAKRIDLADSLRAYIPARCLRLGLPDGAAVLLPGGTASCVKDASIPGLRMTWKLRFFPAA